MELSGGLRNMNKKNIKYLVMDVDGTLTDGKIYMGNSGEVMKAFSVKDGCGIHDILIPSGITPVIITGRKSDIVLNRCNEIGINEVYQGISNKIDKLSDVAVLRLLKKTNIFAKLSPIQKARIVRLLRESGNVVRLHG